MIYTHCMKSAFNVSDVSELTEQAIRETFELLARDMRDELPCSSDDLVFVSYTITGETINVIFTAPTDDIPDSDRVSSKIYTFQQIADHIELAINLDRDDLDIDSFTDLDGDTILSQVEYYLCEARETTITELASRGLTINDELSTIEVRDLHSMTKAYSLTSEIRSEYDATLELGELPTTWWKDLVLGGDDDVDYNGSYLETIFEILDDMLPPEYRAGVDPHRHAEEDYHLPQHIIDARLAAYKADFYEKNPEALVRDTLRSKVHSLCIAVVPHCGLILNDTEFQLYANQGETCYVYKAPRADTGPWVFTCDGMADIVIS